MCCGRALSSKPGLALSSKPRLSPAKGWKATLLLAQWRCQKSYMRHASYYDNYLSVDCATLASFLWWMPAALPSLPRLVQCPAWCLKVLLGINQTPECSCAILRMDRPLISAHAERRPCSQIFLSNELIVVPLTLRVLATIPCGTEVMAVMTAACNRMVGI